MRHHGAVEGPLTSHSRGPFVDSRPASPDGPGSAWRQHPERWALLCAGLIGALVFAYQVPISVVVPTNIRWLMKADRGAALSGWLFERNEPWTLPFGILHTMMPPLVTTVGYSDALPWVAVPAKLFFGWVTVPWQYSGLFLVMCYVLQGVFGYLVLRALGAGRGLSIAGSALFATSPALLQRFEHVSLCAHWEILAAWWLYLRRPRTGPSWRTLVPWLVLLLVSIPTYAYLALMVGALAGATYVRALWIDRTLSWRAAIWHAAVAGTVIYGVFWVFGFFVLQNQGEPGFGRFSSDVLAFFNSAGTSSLLPQIRSVPKGYERYYYLGLGVIALMPIGIGFGLAARLRRPEAVGMGAPRVALWPGLLVAVVMFAYAWATPVRLAGHDVLNLTFYQHMPRLTTWFRGTGRFAWPLYYLVIALTVAQIARYVRFTTGLLLIGAAVALQIADIRPLRAIERREYTWPWPRLESPAWRGLGESFRSVRLVPPIVANRIACRQYDRPFDYEIRFGVLAATEHMAFNSSNPARVGLLSPLCEPMLDSLENGLLDPTTVYIPSNTYREAIEWWSGGRSVCGMIEQANVCVARATAAPLTRLLLAQEPVPPPTVLHFDFRGGQDPAFADSSRGLSRADTSGREIVGPVASVYIGRPLDKKMTMAVEARVDGERTRTLRVAFGSQSRILRLGPQSVLDTLAFSPDSSARLIRFIPDATGFPTPPGGAMTRDAPGRVHLRLLTIALTP